jgi:DNA polymerase I-like protein with 3'-5' exonuclease and polymerase domains
MGPDKLAEVTGLTMAQAESAYNIYHSRTPELRKWWETISREVTRHKALYNSLGRRLIFLERLDNDDALDSIIAYRPQSTIGDKVCQVWAQSEEDEHWPSDARICLNIHDALICLAPLPKLKTCLSIMKRYAERPIPVQSIVTRETREMVIPAETKMSVPTSWRVNDDGVLEYVEDENGMHRWYGMKAVEVE